MELSDKQQNRSPVINLLSAIFITLLLVLLGNAVPVLGILAMVFWAVPLVNLIIKEGIKHGIICSVVVIIGAMFFAGTGTAVESLGLCIIPGLLCGCGFRKKKSQGILMAVAMVCGILCFIGGQYLSLTSAGMDVNDYLGEFDAAITESFEEMDSSELEELLAQNNTSLTQIQEEATEIVKTLLPSVLILLSAFIVFFNFVFASKFIRSKYPDGELIYLLEFKNWHLPWWSLWYLVITLIFYVAGNWLDSDIYSLIGRNMLICAVPLFGIPGIAAIKWSFDFRKASGGFKVAVVIFSVLFITFSLMFYPLIGVMDSLIDYRKKLTERFDKS